MSSMTNIAGSQVARFGGRSCEVVVAPVDVHDRKRGEVCIRHVVESSHHHRDERLAALTLAASEGFDAAVLAEQMVDVMAAELVVAERVLTLEQPELFATDADEPGSSLAAHRAVAPDRALAEINVGFVAHRAAVAAAGISLFHGYPRSVISGMLPDAA